MQEEDDEEEKVVVVGGGARREENKNKNKREEEEGNIFNISSTIVGRLPQNPTRLQKLNVLHSAYNLHTPQVLGHCLTGALSLFSLQ